MVLEGIVFAAGQRALLDDWPTVRCQE